MGIQSLSLEHNEYIKCNLPLQATISRSLSQTYQDTKTSKLLKDCYDTLIVLILSY